ncbi:VOC family protein [Pyxidicoccus caerfyrddinensis]|uniref:VOC family protein n=1 Tax=Pyxidicoccus caerfyrddinensis TaxID=2709663 RepID=UPI0013DCD8A6|nr:hypothetical protein [Pyxidicoccus caerfyrddinensis]
MAQPKAKFIFFSVPTMNSVASRAFYGALLGNDDFARSLNDAVESYYQPLQDGLNLNITQRFDSREPITPYFAVDDLDSTLKALEAAGGRVAVEPREVPVQGPPAAMKAYRDHAQQRGDQPDTRLGRMATVVDPDGGYVGLMELTNTGKKHFRFGKPLLSQARQDDHDNWKKIARKEFK